MRKTLVAALLFTCAAFGADITGRWTGTATAKSPDGEEHVEDVMLVLKQDGSTITGTGGSNEGDLRPLVKPALNGDTLTFDVESDEGAVFHVTLKISGETMTGEAKAEVNGETRIGTLKFQRQK